MHGGNAAGILHDHDIILVIYYEICCKGHG